MSIWLLIAAANAHPIELRWYAAPDDTGFVYTFRLESVEAFSGNVDGIVFADVGNNAPSGAEGLADVALVGDPPAPYDFLDSTTGTHSGPVFENHPADGWVVADLGETLEWQVHASALVGFESVYWSNTRGDSPKADFELALYDCRLANAAPLAERQGGDCEGIRQVCDPDSLRFVEPDYALEVGFFEEIELACDGRDNDCNGVEDDVADPPLADVQIGVCAAATQVCDGGVYVEPDYALIDTYEATEASCDRLDNDCDGAVDDIPGAPLSAVQEGVCAGAVQICDGQGGWTEPDYATIAGYEAFEESCDDLDNDCDGATDDKRQCFRYEGGCRGCGTGSTAGAWWLAGVALLVRRMRR